MEDEFHIQTGHIDSKVGIVMNGVYITHRDSRRHFFRKKLGYPISLSILNKLREQNVKRIRIIEHLANENINVYECDIELYNKAEAFKENIYDQQKCVPLSELKKV